MGNVYRPIIDNCRPTNVFDEKKSLFCGNKSEYRSEKTAATSAHLQFQQKTENADS